MIYTVTFNPSLDYIVKVDNLQLGMTNRTSAEQIFPGGKGINVSMVLQNLGIESTAFGFLAGFTGTEISRLLEERTQDIPIHCDFIHLPSGCSRINMKIQNIDGMEINGMGPDIDADSLAKLKEKIAAIGQDEEDILIFAGSIPPSLPKTIYAELLEMVREKKVECVVDATGEVLRKVLPYQPFLVKPNHHELGELFQTKITTRTEAIPYAKKLQELGAKNVLVSLAGMGAVLVDELGGVHESAAPEGEVKNAVGAGDSMVAGFLTGWKETGDYHRAFLMGLAAGSASAFSQQMATRTEVEKIFNTL